MKFDPHYFLTLTHEAGIELSRLGDSIHFTSHGKSVVGSNLWREMFSKHKAELLAFLPDKSKPAQQLDLFNDPYP